MTMADLLKSEKVERPAGFDLRVFPVVNSTNDIARDIAMSSDPHDGPIVVWGGEQKGGRGRNGRAWASPKGNLYVSILLRDIGDFSTASQLSFVVAVAMRESISGLLDSNDAKCKWPNDILVNGAKICGILLEAGQDKHGNNWILIGTGVNVAHYPENPLYKTTSINELLDGEDIPLHQVLSAYLKAMDKYLKIWREEGFSLIRTLWFENCFGLGNEIVARLANKSEETGMFEGLDSTGGLLLRRKDNSITTVTAGDVFIKEA